MQEKKKDDLAEIWKSSTSTTTMQCLFLHKNNFQNIIFLADMAFQMSDFDNFDNGQIS